MKQCRYLKNLEWDIQKIRLHHREQETYNIGIESIEKIKLLYKEFLSPDIIMGGKSASAFSPLGS